MKPFAFIAIAMTFPVAALAQSNYSFDDEVNAELNSMYEQSVQNAPSSRRKSPQVQVNVQTNPSAVATTEVTQTAPVVQRQATTVVQASPLSESKAEALRRSRQDAEISTEQRIVEKLEEARLQDERRRSEALFGDKFNSLQQNQAVQVSNSPNAVVNTAPQQQTVQQPQTVVPAVVTAPVTMPAETVVVTPAPVAVDRDTVRDEVRASLADLREEVEAKEEPTSQTYFTGYAGMGDYPDVSNVRGKYALGFGIGQRQNERLLVEGSFLFSQFDVEQRDGGQVCGYYAGCQFYPRITRMDQYQGAAQVKYQLWGGMIRPVIGGAAAYSYRTFKDTQFGYANNDAKSHSLDLGVVTGADLEVSPKFALGFEMRYMFNILSRTDNQGLQKSFWQSVYNSDTPIEELQQMTLGLFGRASF